MPMFSVWFLAHLLATKRKSRNKNRSSVKKKNPPERKPSHPLPNNTLFIRKNATKVKGASCSDPNEPISTPPSSTLTTMTGDPTIVGRNAHQPSSRSSKPNHKIPCNQTEPSPLKLTSPTRPPSSSSNHLFSIKTRDHMLYRESKPATSPLLSFQQVPVSPNPGTAFTSSRSFWSRHTNTSSPPCWQPKSSHPLVQDLRPCWYLQIGRAHV